MSKLVILDMIVAIFDFIICGINIAIGSYVVGALIGCLGVAILIMGLKIYKE